MELILKNFLSLKTLLKKQLEVRISALFRHRFVSVSLENSTTAIYYRNCLSIRFLTRIRVIYCYINSMLKIHLVRLFVRHAHSVTNIFFSCLVFV